MITGNYFNKYTSKNPIVKWMMKKFKRDLDHFIKKIKPISILDVGCGEGYLTKFLDSNNDLKIIGIDVGEDVIKRAKEMNPGLKFEKGSIYNLKYKDESFDCVIANEVLEHIEDPDKGLEEIKRASKKYVIISVPNEPFFRLANILRLRYLKRLGNTPGHIQHWNRFQFKRLLRKHFEKVQIKQSTLWNFGICKK